MADRYDAVVIGAGHNGLIAAAYLARAGRSTLLIEARDDVGGCASTVDALGGRVNICNCDHLMVRTTGIVEELDLAAHGLEYIDLDPCTVAMTWDNDSPWALFHDAERTLDSLAVTHPGQVDGYRRYLRAARPAAELMIGVTRGVPRPGNVGRRLVGQRAKGARTLLAWSRRSALDVLRSFFDDDALVLPALTTGPTVWGVAPDTPGTGLAALSYAARHVAQVGRPVGGSGALPAALRACFEAAGGTVRCGTRVTRLVSEGTRIASVELDDGTAVDTDAVVTACDPRAVLLDMIDGLPGAGGRLRSRWQSQPVHEGYESKIDAIVDALPDYRAMGPTTRSSFGGDAQGTTVVISPTVDEMIAAHRMIADGRIAERPMMLANVPSAVDPTMRVGSGADAAHVLSLEVLFTPYSLAGGWEHTDEPTRWLDRWATLVQPGFLDHVRDWRVMTPHDYEREFNMHRGYTPAFSAGPVSALLGRQRELSRYRTPIRNLFLTGAATYPGAGIWGAAGRNAATVALGAVRAKVGSGR